LIWSERKDTDKLENVHQQLLQNAMSDYQIDP